LAGYTGENCLASKGSCSDATPSVGHRVMSVAIARPQIMF